jgi:hypothetical protein
MSGDADWRTMGANQPASPEEQFYHYITANGHFGIIYLLLYYVPT